MDDSPVGYTLCWDEHAEFQCSQCRESFCIHCQRCQGRQVTVLAPLFSTASPVQSSGTTVQSTSSTVSASAGNTSSASPSLLLPLPSSPLPQRPPAAPTWSSSSPSSSLPPPQQQPPQPSWSSSSVSPGQGIRAPGDLCGPLEALANQLRVLQSSHPQLYQQLWTLTNTNNSNNSKAASTLSQEQQRMDTLETNPKLRTVAHSALQQRMDTPKTNPKRRKVAHGVLQQRMAFLKTNTMRRKVVQGALQQRMASLKNSHRHLQGEQLRLQLEFRGLKVKNAILHQELAVMAADRDNMIVWVAALQQQVAEMRADHNPLKVDLQGHVTSMKTGQDTMKTYMDHLKTDCTALKARCNSLKGDLSKVQNDVADLKKDNSDLRSDLKSSKDQVVYLGQRVESYHASLQDKVKKISGLEIRLETAIRQVAFHAVLTTEVISDHTVQTLICDGVEANVGNSFCGQTGIFTAPVSGLYVFFGTTGPCKADRSKLARLDIVMEGTLIGYMASAGATRATTHTTVNMTAGQRVWLRTYSDNEYIYHNQWCTTFTGMLLHPDL